MDGSVATAPESASKLAQDKRAKFVELAESRTVNAIKAIRVIGKLGNKSAYEYEDADVKKIVNALSREVDALKTRLGQKSGKSEVEFKL
jgi:ribosomal protein L7/L12